jgi:phospholipid-binding lipoprotein MlaA
VRGGRCAALASLLCVSLLAGGCASSDFYIRSLPAETPAADNAAEIQQHQAMVAEGAALANATAQPGIGPPLTPEEVPSMLTYDPWERMNRFTYRFNARFDEAIFLPVADKYRRLPSPVRTGIHNFFANLGEVVSVLNYTAQLRPAPGVRSLGRFVINSTLGIGGLFDVATKMNISRAKTGFGATLARWGMHPGAYFVMPLLGPSSLRDGFGFLADFGTDYAINLANLYRGTVGWVLTPLDAVDLRANTNFRYYSTGSPFEYDTVRFLYVRKTLIEDDALRMWHRSGNRHAQTPAGQ